MNYYIITFTKAHYKITEKQKQEIMDVDFNHIEVEGCILKINNIAEILSEDKYYEQYPDKRPEPVYNQFEDMYGDIGNQQIRKPTEKARELMKQGFINHLEDMTEEEKEKAFSEFNVGKPENKAKAHWQAVYDKYKDKERTPSEEDYFKHASKKLLN